MRVLTMQIREIVRVCLDSLAYLLCLFQRTLHCRPLLVQAPHAPRSKLPHLSRDLQPPRRPHHAAMHDAQYPTLTDVVLCTFRMYGWPNSVVVHDRIHGLLATNCLPRGEYVPRKRNRRWVPRLHRRESFRTSSEQDHMSLVQKTVLVVTK